MEMMKVSLQLSWCVGKPSRATRAHDSRSEHHQPPQRCLHIFRSAAALASGKRGRGMESHRCGAPHVSSTLMRSQWPGQSARSWISWLSIHPMHQRCESQTQPERKVIVSYMVFRRYMRLQRFFFFDKQDLILSCSIRIKAAPYIPDNSNRNTGILEEEPHLGVLIKNVSVNRCSDSLRFLSKSQLPFFFVELRNGS